MRPPPAPSGDAPAAGGPAAAGGLATDSLDYPLPPELIATRPAEPRDSARLLVLRRGDDRLEHATVADLPAILAPGDALVFNTSAVAPARLIGRRAATGGRVEGLFIEQPSPQRWVVMLRSGGRLRSGDRIVLLDASGQPGPDSIELLEPCPEGWIAAPTAPGDAWAVLDRLGRTPLPPYILKARQGEARPVPDALDRGWYQTIYADRSHPRSVAAPTAGLHFTARLLDRLAAAGIERIDVTLDVGPGTFRPITAPTVREHRMHAEPFEVSREAAAALRETRRRGGRLVAVGSTSVRVLESLEALPDPARMDGPLRGTTDLLIAPPWAPRHIDAMLTNFHLPRSTLIALVAALVGLERLRAVYAEAARLGYRFYSYGDAMLIL